MAKSANWEAKNISIWHYCKEFSTGTASSAVALRETLGVQSPPWQEMSMNIEHVLDGQ
jgi:hypothetical protein